MLIFVDDIAQAFASRCMKLLKLKRDIKHCLIEVTQLTGDS